jgi:hypothetical protein
MSSHGKRGFDKVGIISALSLRITCDADFSLKAQTHSVDNASLYRHIDSGLPQLDRT